MWAIARYDLRLSDKEFGHMTPRMLDALFERRLTDQRQQWFLVGTIAAAVINSGFCRPKEMTSPIDFVPDKLKPKDVVVLDIRQMSEEEQANYIMNQFFKRR